MGEREILDNGLAVFISERCRFGRDALLLARFSSANPRRSVLDIGAGCGIVSLALPDAGHTGPVTALEISAEGCELMRRAVSQNSLDNYDIVNADLRDYRCERKFDAAVCNPPYFKAGAGPRSADHYTDTARRESACSLDDILLCAKRSLKERGLLALCWRPERLAELMTACKRHSLEPKRLRFVKHETGGEPWLVLLEAALNGGEGLKIEPDIITD